MSGYLKPAFARKCRKCRQSRQCHTRVLRHFVSSSSSVMFIVVGCSQTLYTSTHKDSIDDFEAKGVTKWSLFRDEFTNRFEGRGMLRGLGDGWKLVASDEKNWFMMKVSLSKVTR